MVVVVILVVLVVVVAVSVGATWLLRRRGGDEVHSVEGYQHTLTTLQGIRARSSTGTVRVLGASPGPAASAGAGDGPGPLPDPPGAGGASLVDDGGSTAVGAPRRPSVPESGLVFEDPSLTAPDGREVRTSRHAQERAMTAMNHRSRRLAGPVVAVLLVVVVAVVLAVVGAQAQHRHRRTSSSAVVTTAPANGHPSTSGSSTTTTVPPPTTTAPANFAPSSVTPTSATYMVPSGSFVLNVLVNLGECWVYVRAGATSTTLFEQTVPTGQAANVTVTGPATVELGAPGGTTVTIDQRAVYLPPGFQSPFTMTLQPPAAG